MHIHLMFLPGYLEQCKEIINILNENNISYVVRRIRPQIDPNTQEYLLPNQSGVSGTPLYSNGKIDLSKLTTHKHVLNLFPPELIDVCTKLNLSKKGSKTVLVNRICESLGIKKSR